ncbi:unnamed protein product [Bemisia tabaci]|uniref:LIM zinc-binding domain-containing protein n=1 Tax=Bemisia tabaci TaxID=7038 RepID=A0A9P0F6H2_BEMTA|nr:unnamed protein product [Bemisia tabaci]
MHPFILVSMTMARRALLHVQLRRRLNNNPCRNDNGPRRVDQIDLHHSFLRNPVAIAKFHAVVNAFTRPGSGATMQLRFCACVPSPASQRMQCYAHILPCSRKQPRYGTKCGGCGEGIPPNDLVRKAREKVFHLNCFTCMHCRKQLSTGEELYVLENNRFMCKEDYMSRQNSHESSININEW